MGGTGALHSFFCLPTQYIHSAGVIHRVSTRCGGTVRLGWAGVCWGAAWQARALFSFLQDLKPGNLAVNEDCELKVSGLQAGLA